MDKKILLRGFGLGGWLVQEGYQLHIPGFGSPSSIGKMIVDLIGQENADQFYQRYIANYVTEQDIQKIASWGAIRFGCHPGLFKPQKSNQLSVMAGRIRRKLQLFLNNQPLTELISIPNSGGWKNWLTISTAENVTLPAGSHTLKLAFSQGGFNINLMHFNLKSTPAKHGLQFDSVTDSVFVAQNYPNPFNRVTQIPVLLLEPQQVNLKIYNLNGKLVKDVFEGLLATGLSTIFWDGTNSQDQLVRSGMYLYRFSVGGLNMTKTMILQK